MLKSGLQWLSQVLIFLNLLEDHAHPLPLPPTRAHGQGGGGARKFISVAFKFITFWPAAKQGARSEAKPLAPPLVTPLHGCYLGRARAYAPRPHRSYTTDQWH